MNSYEVLKQAINKTGVKSIASDMNLSTSLIYKWCQPTENEDSAGADNPLDRLLKLYELTNERMPIEWLCQKANGYFVENSKVEEIEENKNLHPVKATQNILCEFSELLSIVSQSIENDQVIDNYEAKQIRDVWDKLKSITENFVANCETGLYNNI